MGEKHQNSTKESIDALVLYCSDLSSPELLVLNGGLLKETVLRAIAGEGEGRDSR